MEHFGSLLLGDLERLAEKDAPVEGAYYRNYFDFLLRNGRVYEPRNRPLALPALAPRGCFFNSILIAAVRGFPYVEGLAIPPGATFAHPHAWNIDTRGRVIDTTWATPGVAYVGVPFSARRADEATWEGDASVLQDERDTLLMQPWEDEDSPGDTDGLLEKMARQAFEHEPFDIPRTYGVSSPDELVRAFRNMAYGVARGRNDRVA